MEFLKYDLGRLETGSIVEITLDGNGAYVRLMDSANFEDYKKGKSVRTSAG